MKKILVTGALGHIGSLLIRRLPEVFPDSPVLMIDNGLSGRYHSLFDLPRTGRYEFLHQDILNTRWETILPQITAVIHLAALTHPGNSFANPDEIFRINTEGTRILAEACAAHGTPLLFPSTTSLYQAHGKLILESDESFIKPQTPYAESKRRAEQILQSLGPKGLPYVLLRLGTIFGFSPGMGFQTAVNKFCLQALCGEKITVWKTAQDQIRPYLYVEDAVRALLLMLTRNRWNGEVFHIATLHASVRDVLKAIQEKIPESSWDFTESPAMNTSSYEVSIEKISQEGFKPRGTLRLAIAEIISALHPLSVPTLNAPEH